MQLVNLSPDVIALAIIALCAVYSVMRGAGGVRVVILGAAAGQVAASQLGSLLPTSSGLPGLWQVAVMVVLLILLALTQHKPPRHGNTMMAGIAGAVAGIFAVGQGLAVVPSASQSWLTSHSFLLLEIQTFSQGVLIAGVVVAILIPFLYHRAPRNHH